MLRLVTGKLLLELPHQGSRLLLLLGLLQALPGEQRLLGLHCLETKGLTLGLRGPLRLGGLLGLLHLEEPGLLSDRRLPGSQRVLRQGPCGKGWMCGSQHRVDSCTRQRALLKRRMVQPLGAGQGLQVR